MCELYFRIAHLDERHAAYFDKATGALTPPVAAAAAMTAIAAGQPVDASALGKQVSGVAFCAAYRAIADHLAAVPGREL